jgi:hypothetical protein
MAQTGTGNKKGTYNILDTTLLSFQNYANLSLALKNVRNIYNSKKD